MAAVTDGLRLSSSSASPRPVLRESLAMEWRYGDRNEMRMSREETRLFCCLVL